ncbi:MAG: hypothetical protein R3F15_06470 [Lysobacterales bacterium]
MPIACAPDFAEVPVEDGLFTLALDFGAAPFVGQQRFVELRVRPGASAGGYTILAPRQLVRATPEALRASAAAAAPWSGLTGVPPGFADGIDNNSGGTVTSIAAGTGLSGGTITGSGSLSIANGGVGSAQLAPGAVGLTQIDTTQVQARIGGSCGIGEYVRTINPDGSMLCDSLLAYLGINVHTPVDDPVNLVGRSSSIAVGIDGLPVIAYQDQSDSALKVAKCSSPACTGVATITTVDDPDNFVAFALAIAIGADQLPVISYNDGTAHTLKVAKCVDPACAGAAIITTVDDPPNNVGQGNDIAIGTDGLPVISYYDATAGALKVAKCSNPACTGAATITTLDDPINGVVGDFNAIAVGSDNLPVISYYDGGAGDLKFAKCANAACTSTANIRTVDNSSNTVGLFSSIAVDGDNLPIISYYDITIRALKTVRCATPLCDGQRNIVTVDHSTADVGDYTSIAIGSDGFPVISYRNGSAGALSVAKCGNPTCSIRTPVIVDDPPNSVGVDTSIAIGADGLPVISHRDTTNEALRVTKCGNLGCQ